MTKMVKIFQDGACRNKAPYNQHMGVGVAVFVNDEYDLDISRAIYFNDLKGNSYKAEWLACQEAMKIAKDIKKCWGNSIITVYSDSEVITRQYNGMYNVTDKKIQEIRKQAQVNGYSAGVMSIKWVPREENKKADKLSKVGLNLYKDGAVTE